MNERLSPMRFPFVPVIWVVVGSAYGAQDHPHTTYLGMYLQGTKIGYSSYSDKPDHLGHQAVVRSDSKTVMDAGLLGAAVRMTTDSTSWTTTNGRPIRMKFLIASAGRTQTVDAKFGTSYVSVDVNNNGAKSTHKLAMPKGMVADDPITVMIKDGASSGSSRTFYVLDPMTVAFEKNEVKMQGSVTTEVKGRQVKATAFDIIDPQATMHVFVSSTGDILRIDGPMGIELIPESGSVAKAAPAKGKYTPSSDLALSTSLTTNKPIEDPVHLTQLDLRISGRDLSNLPSDPSQHVQRDGESWIVQVHPVSLDDSKDITIEEARKSLPEWTKPSLDIPSDSPRFIALAKKILDKKQNLKEGIVAIRHFVNETMEPNAGIGILRDASEVLNSRQGVCRDYAILTTTLLRAAGIPARLAAGIVTWDGTFYYHAWSEAWDGHRWIGVDSTAEADQISAGHIKLAEGNVDTAFAFTFLGKASIEVIDSKH